MGGRSLWGFLAIDFSMKLLALVQRLSTRLTFQISNAPDNLVPS